MKLKISILACLVLGSSLFANEIILPKNAIACASCHGSDFSKAALNKSKIVSEMTEQEIKESLLGYQNGTYGREMKALMTNSVKNLTEAEIAEIAVAIAKSKTDEKPQVGDILIPENLEELSENEVTVLETIIVTSDETVEEDEEMTIGDEIIEISPCTNVKEKESQTSCYEEESSRIPMKANQN